MSIAITQLTQLNTGTNYTDARPCFDPTGTKVIFTRGDAPLDTTGPWNFWTVDIDDPGGETLFFEAQENEYFQCSRADWSWSTNNTKYQIAFTPNWPGQTLRYGLLDPTTKDYKLVYVEGMGARDWIDYPSWYPDGKHIALTDYGNNQLIKVEAHSGKVIETLTDPTVTSAGMCSVNQANDKVLCFAGQPTPEDTGGYDQFNNRIWDMTQPMGNPEVFSNPANGIFARAPWFSHDGNYIAYEGPKEPNGPYQIWIQPYPGPYDASTVVQVTHLHSGSQHVKWSPDCTKLVFATSMTASDGTAYSALMLAELGTGY